MPAGTHGSCIHHLGLNICFDEYNYHDSLQACLIEGIAITDTQLLTGYFKSLKGMLKENMLMTRLRRTELVSKQDLVKMQ